MLPILQKTKTPEKLDRVVRAFGEVLPAREFEAFTAWLCTFYPFQLEWLLEMERFAMCNKSRQIGQSHTTAGAVSIWGAFLGETTTLISIGQRESDEVLEKVKLHSEALRLLGSKWAIGKPRGEAFNFVNSGGRIIAVPSSSAGRSFSGNIFLDEYGYLENSKKVWDGAAAVTLHAGRMRVGSTPNGVGNDWHSLWSNPTQNKGWVPHEFPLQRAIADGMNVDIDACWKMAKGDPRLFSQLFECKFLDGMDQYIPTELISAAEVDNLRTYEGEYYAGLDIGKTVDRTVLVVVRKKPDGHIVLSWIAGCKRTDPEKLDQLVQWAFDAFKLKRLCVDSTGLGGFPTMAMQKKHGAMRVEPVTFTLNSKEELATTMYSAFAERYVSISRPNAVIQLPPGLHPKLAQVASTFAIPEPSKQLQLDICSIRREITAAGNVRYDAPRTDAGHADSAWAFALALHACGKSPGRKQEVAPRSTL